LETNGRNGQIADQRRLAAEIGYVPEPAAEQLQRFRAGGRLPDLAGNLPEPRAALRQQEGVERRQARGG